MSNHAIKGGGPIRVASQSVGQSVSLPALAPLLGLPVKPGCVGAREVLSEPIADKLFFAGEATGGNRSALVNGAYESGRKAAKAISKIL